MYSVKHGYVKSLYGICLDGKKRRDRGGEVHMWTCEQDADATTETNKNQHWDFYGVVGSPNLGMLKNHDGICLNADEATNGGKVWMWPCQEGNKRQQWTFIESARGKWGHYKNENGYCLDAKQRKTVGGTVHMWKCDPENNNQKWIHSKYANMEYWQKQDYTDNILDLDVRQWNGPHLWNGYCDEVAGTYEGEHLVSFVGPDQVAFKWPIGEKGEFAQEIGEVNWGCTGTVEYGEYGMRDFMYDKTTGILTFDNGIELKKED